MRKKTVIFTLFSLSFFQMIAQERKIFSNILLFGEDKKVLAYINKNYTVFHWESGEEIASLIYNSQTQLYDVVDKHHTVLGYWRDGIIFNFYKKIVLAEEDSVEKYMMQLNADKGIKSVILDLEIQGWISLKEFVFTEKP